MEYGGKRRWWVGKKEEIEEEQEGKMTLMNLNKWINKKLKPNKTNIDTSKHININLKYKKNEQNVSFRPFYLRGDKVKTQENYLWCVLYLKFYIGNPTL